MKCLFLVIAFCCYVSLYSQESPIAAQESLIGTHLKELKITEYLENVPDNRNCGKVIRLANGGIELSFFESPLTINPKPINTIKPKKLRASSSMNVMNPLTRVNLKMKWPMSRITMAVIN